jgi:nicotinate-nucleotide pyrophosphorylase (carboxylating)
MRSPLARDLQTLEIPKGELRRIVATALEEDLGWGDITTDNLVPASTQAHADVVFRSPGVVCGIPVLEEVFRMLDENIRVDLAELREGDWVGPSAIVATVHGQARALLKGERVALNFVQRLAAIATATSAYVKACEGLPVHVIDTRKTTPGLRALEKYAIRVGGGRNHRFNLSDGVLVKDNHLVALRNEGIGTAAALRLLRDRVPHTIKIEVLEGGADVILLDNMTPPQAREAVQLIAGRAQTEMSGGVNLATVRAYAEAGVNVVSSGSLTHSTPALDVGLDFQIDT